MPRGLRLQQLSDAPGPTAGPARVVLLVCMPFQHLQLSSLSVALLASVLREHAVPVSEAYLHFEFARILGPRTYDAIASSGARNGIIGELLFAEHHRGKTTDEIDRVLAPLVGDHTTRTRIMDDYAGSCLERVLPAEPEMVGLSTSFNQLFPALWLAGRIKRERPEIEIVLGGAACSAPMGLQIGRYYPEIDLVVSGFGEQALLEIARGKIDRSTRFRHYESRVVLDSLPIPDYEAFLGEQRVFAAATGSAVRLSFESSRGCWWGEKNHCKFCGLNQTEMGFNAKSSSRVIHEIRTLWERHRLGMFATDTILSRAHLKEAIPRLAGFAEQPELFYEVKPNMRRHEVLELRRANVRSIQPGIESLNSRLLGLLDKGVRAIQNVALLKWCRELGIQPVWNLLYGIPGETAADYAAQIALIEHIPHLAPPEGAHQIQIDRFSPYFTKFREYGWRDIAPLPEYRLLHAEMTDADVREVAYHFDGIDPPFQVDTYAPTLRAAVTRWRERHSAGDGLYWTAGSGLLFVQSGSITTLDRDSLFDAVIEHTHEQIGLAVLVERTGATLELIAAMIDLGVLFRDRELIINLAVTVPDGR